MEKYWIYKKQGNKVIQIYHYKDMSFSFYTLLEYLTEKEKMSLKQAGIFIASFEHR